MILKDLIDVLAGDTHVWINYTLECGIEDSVYFVEACEVEIYQPILLDYEVKYVTFDGEGVLTIEVTQ